MLMGAVVCFGILTVLTASGVIRNFSVLRQRRALHRKIY